MTHHQIGRRGFLGAAGAALLVGPGLGQRAQAKTPGRLVFALSSYPPSMRPFENSGTAAATLKLAVNRGLLGYDAEGKLVGELAQDWTREGADEILVKLRP